RSTGVPATCSRRSAPRAITTWTGSIPAPSRPGSARFTAASARSRLSVTTTLLRIRAGHVIPVTAPPIADGAVLVGDDGRIAAVGPNAHVPTPPGATSVEFADGVLTPGLVNTHTHLELTHLAGKNDETEFPKWLRRVRGLKDATPPD